MKHYLVGESRATGKVVLIAYENKDLWNGRDKNDPSVYLTHQKMLSIATAGYTGYFSNWFDSTRKADCMKVIRRDFAGCEVMDYTDYKFVKGYGLVDCR